MGVLLVLSPHPQLPILSLDALPRHPGGRDARVEGALEHLLRQLWFGRNCSTNGRFPIRPLSGVDGRRLSMLYRYGGKISWRVCPPLPEGEKGEQHTTHRWIVGITQHNARKLSGNL